MSVDITFTQNEIDNMKAKIMAEDKRTVIKRKIIDKIIEILNPEFTITDYSCSISTLFQSEIDTKLTEELAK